MEDQAALFPQRKFWVVRLAMPSGTYGPFQTERAADEFAASHGLITSNFVIPVKSPEAAHE